MSTKRSVILRGCPEINEYGVAQAQIKPGYLVKGVSFLAHQTADGTAKVAPAVALEREELGEGIDDSLKGSGTESAFYASGDQVKVAVFDHGDEATMFIASGETVNEDTYLSSAGDGTLEAVDATDYAIARSLENLGTVAAVTAVRVQFV